MIKQTSLIALTLCLCIGHAASPPKGNLRGVATAPQAGVVAGVAIEIVPDVPSPESGNRIALTTDQFGKYVAELAVGQYKICARKRGLEENCRCVHIEEGRDAEVDFSLQSDKAYTLPRDYDVMDRRLQLVAGKDAINCGHVQIRQTSQKETSCALNANKQMKAFYLRYDVPCGDCELAIGLAADALGRLFAVRFDSMGMDTDERDAAETMPDGIFTVVAPCPPRPGLRITSSGALSCFSAGDKVHNIMQQLDSKDAKR